MMQITAIVPMRHHSERVPGKNYRLFSGKPLYHHIVRTLLQCEAIQSVVIDTDSSTIMEDASQHFPAVKLLERPTHLQDGGIPMNEVLLNTTSQIQSEYYLQTHSTNPLLKAETLRVAIQQFTDSQPMYDSMFSVTQWQTRLWDELARPINHNPNILLRTQDLPPLYEENSLFYLFTRHTLMERRNRIGQRPLMFKVDRAEAIDIDEEIDFQVAELMFEKLNLQQASEKPQ